MRHVGAIVKDTTKMWELWQHTYDSWLKIEPEELDVNEETLIHTKYLLNISEKVHFLNTMNKKAIELAQYDYVWIVNFKFRDWKMRWWTDKNQNAHHFEEDSVEVDSVNQDQRGRKDLLAKLQALC